MSSYVDLFYQFVPGLLLFVFVLDSESLKNLFPVYTWRCETISDCPV